MRASIVVRPAAAVAAAFVIVFFLVLSSGSTAAAQTAGETGPQAAAAETPAEPQDETPAAGQPPQVPPAPVDPAEGGPVGEPVRIGPVTLSGGTWVESLFVTGSDPERPIDTFRIRRARIGMAGNVSPRIGWSIGGELSGTPALRVAFVLFRISPLLNVRVGQATPPSGLERSSSPLTSEIIERSRLTLQLTHSLDVGMTVMSQAPIGGWLGYAVSVVNGTGFNRTDDNRAKDVVLRLRVTPPAVQGLTINASAATGEQVFGTRKRASLGAQYDGRTVKIGLDGMRQQTDDNPSSHGVVVFGAWRIRPAAPTPNFRMLEFGARFFFLTDRTVGPPPVDEDGGPVAAPVGPETIRELALGVNYDVTRNVRIMSNVTTPVDDRPDSVTFLTRLQLVF